MKSLKLAVFAVLFCSFFGNPVFAQDVPKGSVSFNVGGGKVPSQYFGGSSGKIFLGGKLRLAPAHETDFWDRFDVYGSLEFSPVSQENFNDEFLGRARSKERFYVMGLGMGFTPLKTDKMRIILSAGPAFTRNSLSFDTLSIYTGQWQGVCRYIDNCESDWAIKGNVGVTMVFYPKGGNLFVGVDANTLKRYGFTVGIDFLD